MKISLYALLGLLLILFSCAQHNKHSMKSPPHTSIDSLWTEADSAHMQDLPVDELRILEEIVKEAEVRWLVFLLAT